MFSECFIAYMACATLASSYVGSLYVWKRDKPSYHPSTVKQRFISIFVVTLLSPFFVSYFLPDYIFKEHSLLELLGFRFWGLGGAMLIPLPLTMILFMGPLCLEAMTGFGCIWSRPAYWFGIWTDILWVRNYVVAPISEEFTFRACMLPLIITCHDPTTAMFICPIFFGAAHLHHMSEQIRAGVRWKVALVSSCFQFTYTSIFGMYSAYLFLRTGHILSPILAHAFCNHMGFPDFAMVRMLPFEKRVVCIAFFIIGILLWAVLLGPCTNPALYENDLPWSNEI